MRKYGTAENKKNRYCTICLLSLFQVALAQWSNDPHVNTRATNGGILPQIIDDGSGGAYIVYQDSPALLRQLWVQRMDRYGRVRFPPSGIRVSSNDRNQTPYYFLASTSDGDVIVVFEDFRQFGNQTSGAVYAQRIDSTGTKLWGDAGVEISSSTHGKSPVSACSDGVDGCLVFWGAEKANYGSTFELWGQRVSAEGELMWTGKDILITAEFASFNVAIPNPAVSDGQGGAIILYSDSAGMKLQRINAYGNFLWKDKGVEIFPVGRQMISDGMGGAIIAGIRFVLDNTGYHFAVGTQRVDSNGHALWGNHGVTVTERADDQTQAVEMAIDSNGDLVLIWSDRRNGKPNIFAQKVSSKGISQWEPNGKLVSVYDSEKNIFRTGVASLPPSGIIIVWTDRRIGEDGLFFTDGLFGQRLDENGNRLWGAEDIAISTKNVRHNTHKTLSDYAGGAIICWSENDPNLGWAIFAQQVSRDGKLGEVLTTSVSSWTDNKTQREYILHPGYPNPFNSEMVIRYELPENTYARLSIFDLSGKEVIALVKAEQSHGMHKVIWNGKNQGGREVISGIYLYQLRAGHFVKTRKALFIK